MKKIITTPLGQVLLIDEDAENIKEDDYTLVGGMALKRLKGHAQDIEGEYKIIAQKFQEGKTDYLVDTLFKVVEEDIDILKSQFNSLANEALKLNDNIGNFGKPQSTLTDEEQHLQLLMQNVDKYKATLQPNAKFDISDFTAGFNRGYKAKQGISKEKYERDLRKAIELARTPKKTTFDGDELTGKVIRKHLSVEEVIQSLNKQPEREVEIVMEVVADTNSRTDIDGEIFSRNRKLQPKTTKKIIDGKEYNVLTIKYK